MVRPRLDVIEVYLPYAPDMTQEQWHELGKRLNISVVRWCQDHDGAHYRWKSKHSKYWQSSWMYKSQVGFDDPRLMVLFRLEFQLT